jgi:hypothetical protein
MSPEHPDRRQSAAGRCRFPDRPSEIEIRPLYEMADLL